jgi:hypothetical protein
LFGQPLPVNDSPMPGVPNWFSEEQATVWRATLAGAPPGLLRAGDADNLVVLCTAVTLYRQLARKLVAEENPSAELIQQLRLVGVECGRATKVLGLNPPERARIGLPATTDQDKPAGWGSVLTVVDGNKAA